VDVAREMFPDDIICVSTDDVKIKNTVESLGLKVPFLRPNELATDHAGTYEVMLHAIDYYKKQDYVPDTIILLQPTSPLRNVKHLKEAINLFTSNIDMVVSVKETKSNPYYVLFEENKNGFLEKSKFTNITRRQDLPKVWELNGAIYIINVESLKKKSPIEFTKIKKFVMDEKHSIDIDTIMDFEFCEYLLKSRKIE